jgi:hypothetical protein
MIRKRGSKGKKEKEEKKEKEKEKNKRTMEKKNTKEKRRTHPLTLVIIFLLCVSPYFYAPLHPFPLLPHTFRTTYSRNHTHTYDLSSLSLFI